MFRSLALAGLIALFPGDQSAQDSQRTAAARFAIANGYKVPPSTRLLVLGESVFPGVTSAKPRGLSAAELEREAERIATITSGQVAGRPANETLQCWARSPQICVPRQNQAVLWVGEPSTTANGVTIAVRLYLPGATTAEARIGTLVHGIVRVQQRAGAWVATGHDRAPTPTPVRVPLR